MRDYSQYSKTTPTKKKPSNLAQTTTTVSPSPASSSVSSVPNYRYNPTATKSQVSLLNRASQNAQRQQKQQQQQQPQQQHHEQQQQNINQQQQPPQPPPQQHHKRDAASINTAVTQSSNSPRSDDSEEASSLLHPNNQQHQNEQSHPHSNGGPAPPIPPHIPQQKSSRQSHIPRPSSASPRKSPRSSPPPQLQHSSSPMRAASPPPLPNPSSTISHDLNSLTPADALSLKRDGAEATILQLRQALEEARLRDAAEKANIAKSDATILELRSSVRQLKRQLEKLDGDARQKHAELVAAKQQLAQLKQQLQKHPPDELSDSQSQSQQHALAKEERVGELQVQLDRAHAQILTADMVRKELEDTLEAEQYTWELRVQDQERTIVELQQEIGVLAEDLEQCRRQWKQADEEWAKKVADLERNLGKPTSGNSPSNANNNAQQSFEIQSLRAQLKQLEEERNELQTCLDEALLELEAVDAELGTNGPAEVQQLRQENQRLQEAVQQQRALQEQQQLQQGDADFDTLEGLKHLYRWLLERSAEGEEKKSDIIPQTSPELLDCIHRVLESMPSFEERNKNNNSNNSPSKNAAALEQKVAQLEAQISQYKGDLQARDESSDELRSSLKEAVALIKPLQDAVDKAGQQKADLQQEIDRLKADHEAETKEMQAELQSLDKSLKAKIQECDQLHHDLHRLQVELEDAKEVSKARQMITGLPGLSPTAAAAAAVAAKTRPPTEQPQELSSLSKARADLKAKRAQEQTLRSLLRDAQNRFHTLNQQNQNVEALNQQLQGRLRDVEEQQSLRDKSFDGIEIDVSTDGDLEKQVATLKQAVKERTAELTRLREQVNKPSPETARRLQEMEAKLAKMETEYNQKVNSEKVLNNSLKEALSLLKPLKTHLEEAEAENKELKKELKTLRRKVTSMEITGMGSVVASPSTQSVDPRSPQGVETPAAVMQEERFRREKEQLEETVRHLESENSQLHDALDEMSRMNNSIMSGVDNLNPNGNGSPNNANSMISSKAEAKLNQELVELKSRYEVTQSRLEDAFVENHTLVEALKEKEESEKDAIEGIRILREKLRKTEMDLENAKFIATTALVQVEQARRREQDLSFDGGFGSDIHTLHSLEEKAIELDLLESSGMKPAASPGSPSRTSQFHHPQQQQQYPLSYMGGFQQHPQNGMNSWAAGKRSRLADF